MAQRPEEAAGAGSALRPLDPRTRLEEVPELLWRLLRERRERQDGGVGESPRAPAAVQGAFRAMP
jgi:hypothetical protein